MDVCDILSAVFCDRRPSVLATVIEVEGHAYRKVGAMMLFAPGRGKVGSISPGCLEADLEARAPAVLASGEGEIVAYNMQPEEDVVWGETVGCGGKLRILLEPVAGELRAALLAARERNEAGEAVWLLRYGVRGGGLRYELAEAPPPVDARVGAPASARPFYEQRLSPRPRLLLFGAGADMDAVCTAAARIGFRLAVADWRPGLLRRERFPDAQLVCGSADEIVRALRVGADDYALVCSHQLTKDREMLERLLPLRPRYVGVMGSRKRVGLLFEGLARPPFVYAPVGLDIGADGPEEIAISVAAELIAVRKRLRSAERGSRLADHGTSAGGGAEPADGAAQAVPRACS